MFIYYLFGNTKNLFNLKGETIMSIEIPRDLEPQDLDLLCDLLPEFFNPTTIGPRLKEIDLDESYKKDIVTGKGFTVTQPPFKKKIKDKNGNVSSKGIKNLHGIHSPYFGSDWNDDNAFATRYSCDCGEKIGKVYEGSICRKCGTKVRFIDVDLMAGHFTSNGRVKRSLIAGKP